MSTTFLILISAFLHAFWNALAKRRENPEISVFAILIFAFTFSALLLPFFPTQNLGKGIFWGISAGFFEAGYVLTLAKVLKNSALGASYSLMRGSAMFFVWTISSFWLDENFSLYTFGGVVSLCFGMHLVSNKSQQKIFLALACGAFIAGYHLCYTKAIQEGAGPLPLFALSLGIACLVILLGTPKSKRKWLKITLQKEYLYHAFSGVVCASSFLFFLIGLESTGAGVALSLRNTSVIFAQMLAVMIGERVRLTQWVGACFIALGASLVTP